MSNCCTRSINNFQGFLTGTLRARFFLLFKRFLIGFLFTIKRFSDNTRYWQSFAKISFIHYSTTLSLSKIVGLSYLNLYQSYWSEVIPVFKLIWVEIIAEIAAISETIFAVEDEAEDSTKAFNQAEGTTEIRTKDNGTPMSACRNRQSA